MSKLFERESSVEDSGFFSMKSSECFDSENSIREMKIADDLDKLHLQQSRVNCSNARNASDLEDDNAQAFEFFFRQNGDGDTHLHISIAMKQSDMSCWLIELAPHPCLLDIVNDQSMSALHLAVMYSEPRVARRLVFAGANTNLQMLPGGNTPLHLACLRGDLECAKALTSAPTPLEAGWIGAFSNIVGADLELWNHAGKTCLHIAASIGHLELVRHLINLGADVHATEGLGGMTAAHLAVESGHREVVLYLAREHPSCLDAVTYNGYTAYQMAREVDQQLAQELVAYGADASSRPASSSDSESSSESGSEDDETDFCSIPQANAGYPRMVALGQGQTAMAVA